MNFDLEKAIPILERTPVVLKTLLQYQPPDWTHKNEGGETWSAFDVVGHLIHGEKTDWIPRMEIILSQSGKPFEPFDRFAQFDASKGKTLEELLMEFEQLRTQNIGILKSKNLSPADLKKTGNHPALGPATLAQLLSTWVVHDLNHLAQISRVMAMQYKEEVGPWVAYLGVLNG